jgi:hypothetical protein
MKRPWQAAAPLALVALSAASCGGAAQEVATPRSAASSAVPDDGALAALDQAEAELSRVLGPMTGASSTPVLPPPAPEPPPPPPPPPPLRSAPPPKAPAEPAVAPADRREQPHADGLELPQPPDRCATACTAFASMQRAAEHVCSIAGAEDARCKGAEERVKGASARVHAACPACGG